MQWAIASIPVPAVSLGGTVRVSSGSQIASRGRRCGLTTASFRPLDITMTAARPTSDPVPAVVGTAIIGATAGVIRSAPPTVAAYCSSEPACVAIKAAAFARSRGEPPPMAMIPSQRSRSNWSAAAATASSVGFSGVAS